MKHIKIFELFTKENHPDVNEYRDKIANDINGILVELKDNNIDYNLVFLDKRPNFMLIHITLKEDPYNRATDSSINNSLFKKVPPYSSSERNIDTYIVDSFLMLNDYLLYNDFSMEIFGTNINNVRYRIDIENFKNIYRYQYTKIEFIISKNKKSS
jgi:hypothetical protein